MSLGVTPFQCHVCGRQCRRKSELEKHIQTHTNSITNITSDGLRETFDHEIIKIDRHSSENNARTLDAGVNNHNRINGIVNEVPQSQIAPVALGIGSVHQPVARSDNNLQTMLSRGDNGVHMIRESTTTVMSGGQQIPIIMTHMDDGTMRQV